VISTGIETKGLDSAAEKTRSMGPEVSYIPSIFLVKTSKPENELEEKDRFLMEDILQTGKTADSTFSCINLSRLVKVSFLGGINKSLI
jgi:hypothetical protein